MPIATMAIAGGVLGVIGGIFEDQAKNAEYARQMANYGMQHAQVEAQAAYDQVGLSAQARSVQENTEHSKMLVEQNRMAAQAQAEVNSAAAGASGNSVDVQQAQMDLNAGGAIGNLAKQEQAQLNQIEQASRDINISAQSQIVPPKLLENEGALLDIFGSGLQGFLMGRG